MKLRSGKLARGLFFVASFGTVFSLAYCIIKQVRNLRIRSQPANLRALALEIDRIRHLPQQRGLQVRISD